VPPALAAFDLVPGPGLAPAGPPNAWLAGAPTVAFAAAAELGPGWYRVRLRLRAADRHAVRKRGELAADFDDAAAPLESFEWNESLSEDLIVPLPRPARGLRLTLHHADGRFRIDRFEVRRVTKARALARAVRLKVGLLATYNCFWPVVARGGKLLAEGRVREFGRKLFKGLGDSRTMRIEVKQAAEANAAWWRRRALPAEQAAILRRDADAIPDPVPLAVVIPADPTRVNHARHAFLSVCLQLYPHWEVLVAWPGENVPERLTAAVGWERRTRIVTSPAGLGDAVVRALRASRCEYAVVLPPDWELAEHALLKLAGPLPARRPAGVVAEAAGHRLAAVRIDRLLEHPPPRDASTADVIRWAGDRVPADCPRIAETLAFPMNAGPARVGAAGPAGGPPLVLAADIRGITGWDYVAFTLLSGLRSLGIDVRKPRAADMKPDLIPPDLRLRSVVRTPADPQLVVAPPFGLGKYDPDENTAVLTMWESDRLEPKWVHMLNRAGLVIVPSRWAVGCFRASGVTAPLEAVPLGYDPLVFHQNESPPIAMGGLCTFGTAGAISAGGLRKNIPRVIALFREAFPSESDVRLRVKITPNCPPLDLPDDPRIEVLRAALPHADLAAWNRSLTCYVNASFAEGFGLHLLEAMACGRPLISTQYSGLTEFFDAQVGYVIPHHLTDANNDVYSGRWADPDDAGIIDAMRRVYHDRDEARRLGLAAAARARRFTWRDTGRKLVTVLRRHGFLQDMATDEHRRNTDQDSPLGEGSISSSRLHSDS
jgi:glycosyltransferase involved in cell wall biosynthesis